MVECAHIAVYGDFLAISYVLLNEILVEGQRCGLHIVCIMRYHYAARGTTGAWLEYGGIFYAFGGVGDRYGYAVLLEKLCSKHLIEHGTTHFGTRHGHKHPGMALLAASSGFYGGVHKGKHHMYVVAGYYFIEFLIHGGVAIAFPCNYCAYRSYRLLLAQFVAENLHVASKPFAGTDKLLCHCHALGASKHQYIKISMHAAVGF